MPKIRTRIEPQNELDVSEAEAQHLRRLDIVLDTKAITDEGVRRAAVTAAKKESDQ